MSIFSLVNNLKQIKTNIMTSLMNKGVEVPGDAKLESVPALIDNIEVGGGGGEDLTIDGIAYLFRHSTSEPHNISNIEIFDTLIKYINQPKSLYHTCSCSDYKKSWLTNDKLNKLISTDLTKVTNMFNSFSANGSLLEGEYIFNIPSCTNLERAFYNWYNTTDNEKVVKLDFQGSTKNVTIFSYAFYGASSNTLVNSIKSIKNINMDKVTTTTSCLLYAKSLDQLTFDGSFGGNSSSSSLTLDLATTGLTHDAIIETFTTISTNTKGNTRIIKLSQTLYNSLAEEELTIATNKGYTVSY